MQEVRVITPRAGGGVEVQTIGVEPARSREEYAGLNIKRAEINDQIGALRRRRNNLEEQMHRSEGATRLAIQQRMTEVDDRVVRLESQLDQINDRIASTPATVLTAETAPARRDPDEVILARLSDNVVPIAGMFSVFFLAPIAIAFARLIWKRANAAPKPVLAEQAAMQRLDHLQRAVDTIAVEVERISEGQRFVSKLMHEREPQALGARSAPSEKV